MLFRQRNVHNNVSIDVTIFRAIAHSVDITNVQPNVKPVSNSFITTIDVAIYWAVAESDDVAVYITIAESNVVSDGIIQH